MPLSLTNKSCLFGMGQMVWISVEMDPFWSTNYNSVGAETGVKTLVEFYSSALKIFTGILEIGTDRLTFFSYLEVLFLIWKKNTLFR